MNIFFVTGHYAESKRKAGFHWLADAFWQQGHDVTFMTTGISWTSFLNNDHRLKYPDVFKCRNTLQKIKERFYSYIYFPFWHPVGVGSKFIEQLAEPFWDLYTAYPLHKECIKKIRSADIVIFESMNGLFFFDKIQKESPNSYKVYRCSDELRTLRSTTQKLLFLEQELLSQFDLISSPHHSLMEEKFAHCKNAKLHLHGIDEKLFSHEYSSPYGTKNNIIFVGVGLLDFNFIDTASKNYPEYNFTIIGPYKDIFFQENIHFTGEISFEETVSYIIHADIGLMTIQKKNESFSSLTDTLKTQQYRYVNIPIIAPDFIHIRGDKISYYEPENEKSIIKCIEKAFSMVQVGNHGIDVKPWGSVVNDILTDLRSDV